MNAASSVLAPSSVTESAAGASLATTAPVTLPDTLNAGPHVFAAVADAGDAIPEANDDGAAANGLVAGSPIDIVRPDLRVTALTGPAEIARGGLVRVSTTVLNGAAVPARAAASTLRFYLSDDAVFDAGVDTELAAVRAIPSLAPGTASAGVTTLAIPAFVGTGNRFLLARVDPLSEPTEADEANNVAALAVSVQDLVDLEIAAVAGPATAVRERTATVSFAVRNAGTAAAGAFRVNFFLADAASGEAGTPGAGFGVGFKDIPTLAAGARLATTATITLPDALGAGPHVLSAVADAGDAIPEANGNDGVTANGRAATNPVNVVVP